MADYGFGSTKRSADAAEAVPVSPGQNPRGGEAGTDVGGQANNDKGEFFASIVDYGTTKS